MWYVINAKLTKPKLGSFHPDVTTNGNRSYNLEIIETSNLFNRVAVLWYNFSKKKKKKEKKEKK